MRCFARKENRHAKLNTDMNVINDMSRSFKHNHEPDNRTTERKVLREPVKRKSADRAIPDLRN